MRKRESDSLTALRVRECIESPGWQLIRQRIEQSHAAAVADLCRDLDESPTAKVRGKIEAFRTVLTIPEILIQEGNAAPISKSDEEVL